jgi:Putative prokaryotic signal transducing protein
VDTVCIVSTDDEAEVTAVRDLLEQNGVPTLIKNFYTQNMFGGVKPFSGHDPIAGSMEVHVLRDDLKRGLELLGIEELPLDRVPPAEPSASMKTFDEKQAVQRRTLYICTVLTALSFLILPYLLNLPLLFSLRRERRTLFFMLLFLSTAIAAIASYFFFSEVF